MKKEQLRRDKTDWSEIYRKMEKCRIAIEKDFSPDMESKSKILKKRAKLLAREIRCRDVSDKIEVLEFILGGEKYAIEAIYIREVLPLKKITFIPCTPSFVLGIIEIRRQIISVINIKKFFQLPEKGLTDLNKIIILKMNDMEIGILADIIIGVKSVYSDEIQPPPTLTGIGAEYLKGVTKEPVIILDVLKILSDRKIIVNDEMDI